MKPNQSCFKKSSTTNKENKIDTKKPYQIPHSKSKNHLKCGGLLCSYILRLSDQDKVL